LRPRLAIVLLATALCMGWVLSGIDWSQGLDARGVHWERMGLVMLFFMLTHMARALRMILLLEQRVSYRSMFSVTSVGFLAINVIPFRLGEFVRPYLLLEKHQIPFGTSLAAVVLERLLDLLFLLLMLLGVSFLVALPEQGILVGDIDVVSAGQTFAGVVMALGTVVLVVVLVLGPRVTRLLERTPIAPEMLGRVAHMLEAFRDGVAYLLRRPLRAGAVLLCTAGVWLFTLIAVYWALSAFPGIPATWQSALTTWSITLTGMTVAPTPGFFGSYEVFCMASLMLWQVGTDLAGTFAIVLHLAMFLFTIVIGFLFLSVEGWSLKQVVSQSRSQARQG
jgi:uncharacterized protein (TIRG00374 family)